MIAPRRFLPSIPSLLALEAVERLGTATAAAEELSLSHSAVSRQLKVLEEQIGVTLLRREGKGLALTSAGTAYARSVRDILEDLARASLRVRADGVRDSLSLAVPPSFATHWLTPRLRRFHAAHPDILVHLGTRLGTVDFRREKFDAAIHYGAPDWPGTEHLLLTRDRVIPVCAPGLLAAPPDSAETLLSAPLLHLESRPGGWEHWFERHGCAAQGLRGMLFDQFATMAEAAAQGFGIALLPEFLAEIEFSRGRLVAAWPDYLELDGAYYLATPASRPASRSLELFMRWIAGIVTGTAETGAGA
ncbi:LysR substrate-binding domain-containing protein [Acidimangrovimonas pyrenivorans]|uniref:LysR substrate-binding domain-containing protein n=1 Tax=Acidimangrovimonas pyrenivorans TaxID=2030798 RepID=A0ABV7AHG9_9RHOB